MILHRIPAPPPQKRIPRTYVRAVSPEHATSTASEIQDGFMGKSLCGALELQLNRKPFLGILR